MEIGELLISVETINRIFVLLLYVPVGLISYWRLIPRLSPTSKRIASGFLVAQILVIVLSIEIRPTSDFEEWLWKLDSARNIPSTLASTQLVLVGVVALTTAWLARARPPGSVSICSGSGWFSRISGWTIFSTGNYWGRVG